MVAPIALDHIRRTRIIAILRGSMLGKEVAIAEALVEGGITAIEVSAVSPGFEIIIRNLQRSFEGRAAIGAGTVLKPAELYAAVDAGASFVVSPNTNTKIVAESRKLGLASFPGAYTATEIVKAMDAGADAVKVFPAVSLGPEYIRALRGPLPDAKLVPTGGVGMNNLAAFLDAGSFAAGLGSELVGRSEIEETDFSSLKKKARLFADMAQRMTSHD